MDTGFVVQEIDSMKGKGLVATRPFMCKQVIFEETPMVCCQFSWNAAYGYSACDQCMRPLETAEENARRLTGCRDLILPYPECCPTDKTSHTFCPSCNAQYCSEKCRQLAWDQHHRTLCHKPDPAHPLNELNGVWKQIHYPPETTCIMLLARIVALVEQGEEKQAIVDAFGDFSHSGLEGEEADGVSAAHRLLGLFTEQIEALRNIFVRALPTQNAAQWMTLEGFSSLMAMVGANGQGVGTSVFSQWVNNVVNLSMPPDQRREVNDLIKKLYDKMEECVGMMFLNNEGSALYFLQRLANHSCDPNASITFPRGDNSLQVIALRDIAPGEEICTSYLDECNLERSRHSRQKVLRGNYFFTCHCARCLAQADDPEETSEDEDDSDEEEEEED